MDKNNDDEEYYNYEVYALLQDDHYDDIFIFNCTDPQIFVLVSEKYSAFLNQVVVIGSRYPANSNNLLLKVGSLWEQCPFGMFSPKHNN